MEVPEEPTGAVTRRAGRCQAAQLPSSVDVGTQGKTAKGKMVSGADPSLCLAKKTLWNCGICGH